MCAYLRRERVLDLLLLATSWASSPVTCTSCAKADNNTEADASAYDLVQEIAPNLEVSLLQHDISLARGLSSTPPTSEDITFLLHIGKTGGTSLDNALESRDPSKLVRLGHIPSKLFLDSRINKSISTPSYRDIVFFVRSPVHRYVSSWLSTYRRICDPQDKNCVRWEDVEDRPAAWIADPIFEEGNYTAMFQEFATPDDLACSLGSEDASVSERARQALEVKISHTYRGVAYYLGGLEGAKTLVSQMLFVGTTEHLQDDYKNLVSLLSARNAFLQDPPLELPRQHNTDDINPELKMLGRCAVLNLHRYFSEDYRIIRFLAEQGLVRKSYFEEVLALDAAPQDGHRNLY